jgi:kinesin family member C1
VQELKGNIRVYCRVRPAHAGESSSAGGANGGFSSAVARATSGLDQDKRVEVTLPPVEAGRAPAKHSFGLDRVFGPEAGQGEVFDEISQLVQSAIDGFKVRELMYY